MNISIAACNTYESQEVRAALTELLSPLGGLDWVRPHMKIAIKANLVTFMKPEAAATTHPSLLCALIEMLTEKGACVTLGDSPGGLYNNLFLNRVYAATGMKAAEQAGATLNHDFTVKEATFPQAKVAKTFSYTGWLDDADAIINFCKLKTHGMMAMSGAAKNMFGVIPGTVKPEYHYRFPNPNDFADMIIDLNEYFKTRLAIIDGVVGMEGNGPTAGTPRPIGLLIASENPHAADLIGCSIIGLNPKEVPTLTAAMRRGLIPENPEDLQTVGINWKDRIISDYQLVETTHSLRFSKDSEKFFGKVFSKIADRALASRPKLKKKMCIGCRECEKICPADAITMKRKKPKINSKNCIRCFCCQEFCPKGVLKAHRPTLAKFLSK